MTNLHYADLNLTLNSGDDNAQHLSRLSCMGQIPQVQEHNIACVERPRWVGGGGGGGGMRSGRFQEYSGKTATTIGIALM